MYRCIYLLADAGLWFRKKLSTVGALPLNFDCERALSVDRSKKEEPVCRKLKLPLSVEDDKEEGG